MFKLKKKDIPKAVDVLKDAFQNDPVGIEIFAGDSGIDQKLRAFFEIPVTHCLKYGEVLATSEKMEGIAAWVPGDLTDITFWRLLRSGAIQSGLKLGKKTAKKIKPIFERLQEDRKENMKGRPFIHLQLIGVALEFQGRGFGGELLRALIEESERSKHVLYLETQTEKNACFYQRFGFDLINQISLPVINLPMWEMARKPQRERGKSTGYFNLTAVS